MTDRLTRKDDMTCPKCNSNQTYCRVASSTKRCQKCGLIWDMEAQSQTVGGTFDNAKNLDKPRKKVKKG